GHDLPRVRRYHKSYIASAGVARIYALSLPTLFRSPSVAHTVDPRDLPERGGAVLPARAVRQSFLPGLQMPFGSSTCLSAICSSRSEEHTSELQSRENLVCRLLLEKKISRQAGHSGP